MYSKRFLRALVTEVIVAIVIIIVMGVNSKSLMAQPNPEGNITYLGLPAGDKAQQNASVVWDYIKGLEETQLITSEKNYSVTIFMHEYSVGMSNPGTAEWVAVVSSIPETGEEVKVLIVRLDYLTLNLTGIDKFTYPGGIELSLEEIIPIMEEEIRLRFLLPGMDCPVCANLPPNLGYPACCVPKARVQISGGDYIYTKPACDFGATIIVNKYAGKPIFFATTIWSGSGELIIPQRSPLPERNIYIEGIETKGISKEVCIPVRIQNAPCEVDTFGFEVTYDANVFEYTGLERGDLTEAFKSVEAYPSDAGRLRIEGYTDEHGISESASGYLLCLNFKLKAGEEYDIYLFQLENLEVTQFSKSGGCLSIRCQGDVNGDGVVTPGDALLAFRCYLGAGPCLDCSDYNHNGKVTPDDARYIFSEYLKLSVPFGGHFTLF